MKKIITGDQLTVLATVAMAILAMNALQPVLPLYLSSIGVSPATIGFMFSVAMIGMVIGESAGGRRAEQIRIKNTANYRHNYLCSGDVLFCLHKKYPRHFFNFFVLGNNTLYRLWAEPWLHGQHRTSNAKGNIHGYLCHHYGSFTAIIAVIVFRESVGALVSLAIFRD